MQSSMLTGVMLGEYLLEEEKQPFKHRFVTVLRSAPSRFSVEHFLSPGKSTGDYHHGMRISLKSQRKKKSTSIPSHWSLSDYDIWRSWEDCLLFQQTLEEEYGQAVREEKRRLAQGNGLYDLAHCSARQDIHEHLPTLTRRGTILRASQATIDQRQAELIAFIRALFSNDMPAVIKEIQVSRVISDFFGLWGSDFDFAGESQTLTEPISEWF